MSETKTASFMDKSTWARGPWDDEPDRIEWRILDCSDLACLIVRGPMGSLCGYVGVPPGHPAHGEDYHSDVFDGLDVHGDLTFAERCQVLGDGRFAAALVCHVPAPGESDDVWWLGFDCGHAWDVSPGLDARIRRSGHRGYSDEMNAIDGWPQLTYKPVPWVQGKVESLARQLAAMVKP